MRPLKEPYGAMTRTEYATLKPNEVFYGVWRRSGRVEKFSNDRPFTGGMWCNPNNERRAFKNYLHAYAYSLAIKARRAAEKNCDQQESHQQVPGAQA